MNSIFETIGGIPVHPLVVHFAVVLLPLSVVSLIACIYLPKFRTKFAFTSIAGILLGTGAAFVAKESGEALAGLVGNPVTHANYGDMLPVVSFLFLLVSAFWYRLTTQGKSSKAKPLGHLVALFGVGVLVLTFLTGHSGAEAVWKGKIDSLSAPAPVVTDKQPLPAKKPSGNTISMSEVSQHASRNDCWSVVNGNVYNLTAWIDRHPGGANVIAGMCGRDGTSGFNGQHRGEGEPAADLAKYKIGVLG